MVVELALALSSVKVCCRILLYCIVNFVSAITVRNTVLTFYVIYLPFQELLDAASDVMSDWLDKHHGAEVTDNKIFDDLPKLYEDKFHQDMAALNVWHLALSFVWTS